MSDLNPVHSREVAAALTYPLPCGVLVAQREVSGVDGLDLALYPHLALDLDLVLGEVSVIHARWLLRPYGVFGSGHLRYDDRGV